MRDKDVTNLQQQNRELENRRSDTTSDLEHVRSLYDTQARHISKIKEQARAFMKTLLDQEFEDTIMHDRDDTNHCVNNESSSVPPAFDINEIEESDDENVADIEVPEVVDYEAIAHNIIKNLSLTGVKRDIIEFIVAKKQGTTAMMPEIVRKLCRSKYRESTIRNNVYSWKDIQVDNWCVKKVKRDSRDKRYRGRIGLQLVKREV